jgi:hypothetical protein
VSKSRRTARAARNHQVAKYNRDHVDAAGLHQLCPHNGKRCYPTKQAAKQALSRLPATHRRGTTVYRHEACGTYHLGRRSP